jgi:hypothetical protein
MVTSCDLSTFDDLFDGVRQGRLSASVHKLFSRAKLRTSKKGKTNQSSVQCNVGSRTVRNVFGLVVSLQFVCALLRLPGTGLFLIHYAGHLRYST